MKSTVRTSDRGNWEECGWKCDRLSALMGRETNRDDQIISVTVLETSMWTLIPSSLKMAVSDNHSSVQHSGKASSYHIRYILSRGRQCSPTITMRSLYLSVSSFPTAETVCILDVARIPAKGRENARERYERTSFSYWTSRR